MSHEEQAPRIPRSHLNNLTSRRALYFAAEMTGADLGQARLRRKRDWRGVVFGCGGCLHLHSVHLALRLRTCPLPSVAPLQATTTGNRRCSA